MLVLLSCQMYYTGTLLWLPPVLQSRPIPCFHFDIMKSLVGMSWKWWQQKCLKYKTNALFFSSPWVDNKVWKNSDKVEGVPDRGDLPHPILQTLQSQVTIQSCQKTSWCNVDPIHFLFLAFSCRGLDYLNQKRIPGAGHPQAPKVLSSTRPRHHPSLSASVRQCGAKFWPHIQVSMRSHLKAPCTNLDDNYNCAHQSTSSPALYDLIRLCHLQEADAELSKENWVNLQPSQLHLAQPVQHQFCSLTHLGFA